MRVVVPFGVREPVTRLDSVLSTTERRAFAQRMLSDVLAAIRAAGGEPELLADAPVNGAASRDENDDASRHESDHASRSKSATPAIDADELPDDVPVTVDDRSLTVAVNGVLTTASEPIAVVMSDLALATPRAIDRLWDGGDVVIAPGRGGGTNALVVDHPEFRVDYHGASYLDHLRTAREIGATVREVDSMRLATDVDEPDDLAELLLHGDGAAADWLRDAGFELDVSGGRVGVTRDE